MLVIVLCSKSISAAVESGAGHTAVAVVTLSESRSVTCFCDPCVTTQALTHALLVPVELEYKWYERSVLVDKRLTRKQYVNTNTDG